MHQAINLPGGCQVYVSVLCCSICESSALLTDAAAACQLMPPVDTPGTHAWSDCHILQRKVSHCTNTSKSSPQHSARSLRLQTHFRTLPHFNCSE